VTGVFLRRPLSLRFSGQDFVRMAAKRLFKPGRRATQTRAKIRQQVQGKRKLKLALKPDGYLTQAVVSIKRQEAA
jgi:hypothetical protein